MNTDMSVFPSTSFSAKSEDNSTNMDGITPSQLKSYVERIERLTEEKDSIAADIRDIYSEAKGSGFDVKVLRKIISLRRMDHDDRREQDELLELYKTALGML